MKNKTIFCIMLLAACALSVQMNAQIKVAYTGKVGVGIADNITPLSTLSVGCQGYVNRALAIEKTTSYGMSSEWCNVYSKINAGQGPAWHSAVFGQTVGVPNVNRIVGVEGRATKTASSSTGRSYGVIGVAGMCTPGWNYGVIGFLATSNDEGAGVYGALTYGSEGDTGDRYAGYFNGKTKVNGDFYATSVNTTSDARLKTNIKKVETETLQKMQDLQPVRFNWQQVETVQETDTAAARKMYFSEDMDYDRSHYGFLAQDVQKLFPELVHEDRNGYMSVNYVELIPLLVQAVQELSIQVIDLQNSLSDSRPNKTNKSTRPAPSNYAQLFQNTPNPFRQNTTIGYILPKDTHEASIHIYDMSGTEFAAFPIDTFGQGELIINGGTLRAGMYLYTLIADGHMIDTKQMILTD